MVASFCHRPKEPTCGELCSVTISCLLKKYGPHCFVRTPTIALIVTLLRDLLCTSYNGWLCTSHNGWLCPLNSRSGLLCTQLIGWLSTSGSCWLSKVKTLPFLQALVVLVIVDFLYESLYESWLKTIKAKPFVWRLRLTAVYCMLGGVAALPLATQVINAI